MYQLLKPILFSFDPERMHHWVTGVGKLLNLTGVDYLLAYSFHYEAEILQTQFCGIPMPNPIGLAAGFDKNAELVNFLPKLGFGHLEIGSVTAQAWQGNKGIRLFRLPEDQAIVNRMGLPNDGVKKIIARLKKYQRTIPLGINITKTPYETIMGEQALQDVFGTYRRCYAFADYLVINISCPNTADGKSFEDAAFLEELLKLIMRDRREQSLQKPILIKLSPDIPLDQLNSIVDKASQYEIDGYVVGNTTTGRQHLTMAETEIKKMGKGGLSGRPLFNLNLERVKYIYKNFPKTNIIGLGGIFSAEDAYQYLKAGAHLIQLYTGLIYQGPYLVKEIKKGLEKLMERDGVKSIGELHR